LSIELEVNKNVAVELALQSFNGLNPTAQFEKLTGLTRNIHMFVFYAVLLS
jgi:hypothetical protein